MNKTYIPALIVTVALAAFHFIATAGQWYVRYAGFDIFMHILGGAAIALAIYWMIRTFLPSFQISFWKIVGLTLLAGIAWEAFEALNNIAGAPVGTLAYYVDTLKDICDDVLGSIIVAVFLK
jgi:hypothetical protein